MESTNAAFSIFSFFYLKFALCTKILNDPWNAMKFWGLDDWGLRLDWGGRLHASYLIAHAVAGLTLILALAVMTVTYRIPSKYRQSIDYTSIIVKSESRYMLLSRCFRLFASPKFQACGLWVMLHHSRGFFATTTQTWKDLGQKVKIQRCSKKNMKRQAGVWSVPKVAIQRSPFDSWHFYCCILEEMFGAARWLRSILLPCTQLLRLKNHI